MCRAVQGKHSILVNTVDFHNHTVEQAIPISQREKRQNVSVT